jgi:hypothetical protein
LAADAIHSNGPKVGYTLKFKPGKKRKKRNFDSDLCDEGLPNPFEPKAR